MGAFGSAVQSVRSVSAKTRAMRRDRRDEARVRRWNVLKQDALDGEMRFLAADAFLFLLFFNNDNSFCHRNTDRTCVFRQFLLAGR